MHNELLKKKIVLCQESLASLAKIFPENVQALLSDTTTLAAVERFFQIVVDSAVDINNELLLAKGKDRVDTYYSSFVALGDAGLVPRELAAALAASVGLRNTLVHRYETIDRDRMFFSMKKFIGLYQEYLVTVARIVAE